MRNALQRREAFLNKVCEFICGRCKIFFVRFARIGHRGRSGPAVRTNAKVERDPVNGHA